MSEEEAAARLAALLNEIQAAGYEVQIAPNFGFGYHLAVGEGSVHLVEPLYEGEPWEVRL